MSERRLPQLPTQRAAPALGFDGEPQAGPGDATRGLIAVLRRRRWLIVASVVVMLALAGAYTWWSTPVYEGTSQLRFEEQQLNLPQLVQEVSSNNRINTEVEVLQNRSSATATIDSLGLRVTVTKPRRVAESTLFALLRAAPSADTVTLVLTGTTERRFTVERAGTGPPVSAGVGDTVNFAGVTFVARPAVLTTPQVRLHVASVDQAVAAFESSLDVGRPSPDADLVSIRIRNSDPVRAAAAANLMAEQMIRRRQRLQHARTGSAVGFLREQLDTLGEQLRAAEGALASYSERAQAVAPAEQARTQVGRLAQIQADRASVEAERDALAALLRQMDSAAAAGGDTGTAPASRLVSFPTLFRNQATSELLGALAQVQNQRTELLSRRTPEDPDVKVLTNRIREIDNELRTVAETYLQGLDNQVTALRQAGERFGSALDSLPAKEVETARLQRDVQVRQDLYTLIQTRLKEAEITDAVVDPTVSVVDRAVVADKPVRPNPILNLAVALVLGSVIGVAGAIGREVTDRSIRSRADAMLGTGIPVLGAVPRIERKLIQRRTSGRRQHRSDPSQLVAGRSDAAKIPRSTASTGRAAARIRSMLVIRAETPPAYSEALNQLYASVMLTYRETPLRSVAITSPLPGEGKTLTSINLALTVAERGLRVLLVDGDLRRGLVSAVFACHRQPGLAELLRDAAPLEQCLRDVPVGSGAALTLLPTGELFRTPGPPLRLQRVRETLAALAPRFDLVLIDTPPVNLLADAALIGSAADAVLVVVRTGHTTVDTLGYAMDQLAAAQAPVIGTILNDIDLRRHGRDDASYRYLTEVERYYQPAAAGAEHRS